MSIRHTWVADTIVTYETDDVFTVTPLMRQALNGIAAATGRTVDSLIEDEVGANAFPGEHDPVPWQVSAVTEPDDVPLAIASCALWTLDDGWEGGYGDLHAEVDAESAERWQRAVDAARKEDWAALKAIACESAS